MYWPPARGIMAANSPYDNAAASVSTPAMIHDSSNQPVLPTSLAISPATMKIPDPIIEPATIMVESKSPRLRFSSRGWTFGPESPVALFTAPPSADVLKSVPRRDAECIMGKLFKELECGEARAAENFRWSSQVREDSDKSAHRKGDRQNPISLIGEMAAVKP
jgi:hypothetical protein